MPKTFSIKEALGNGWRLATGRFWFYAGLVLITFAVAMAPELINRAFGVLLPSHGTDISAAQVLVAVVGGLGVFVMSLVSMALNSYLDMGAKRLTMRAVRGNAVTYNDLISEPVPYLNYLLASLLAGAIVFFGFLLLIIPGIYFGIALSLVGYVVIDRKLGPVEAVQQGWNLTRGVRGKLALFGSVVMLVNIAGALCLLVGLLVTIPLTMLAMADVYRQLADNKPIEDAKIPSV